MYIAVDVGGTKTLLAVFSEEGRVLETRRLATDPEYEGFASETARAIADLAGSHACAAIAVAMPGVVDYDTQIVRRFGNLQWRDVDIRGRLQHELGLPVTIDNDANLGCLGEAVMGSGRGYNTVLYVTLSTGIGTGITVGGSIPPVLAKSEGGQMHFRHDGRLMRWEHFASGKAFYERWGKMGRDQRDPAVWKEYAEDVSLGLGSLIAVIQPDVIVIGGSMGEHLGNYADHLRQYLEEVSSPVVSIPPIVAAHDPENAVIYGCYVAASRSHGSPA